MAKYDVFITCKSEDYKYAEEIYDFLVANGVCVFLASKELRKLGESEYRRVISNAMQQAYHLIIFASRAEYIDSTWVYYEWDMFVNAKLKGFKPGNIITILHGIKTEEINMDLWKYESLEFSSFKDTVLRYVETEQTRKRKQELTEAKRKEENEKKKREQQLLKQKELKKQLIECAEDYQKNIAALSVDASQIRLLLNDLGCTSRVCPVCSTTCDIDREFCETCGWQLSPISGVEETKYLDNPDRKQLEIHKKIYRNSLGQKPDTANKVQELIRRNKDLEAQLSKANKRVETLCNENSSLKTESNQKHTFKSQDIASTPVFNGQCGNILKRIFPDWQFRELSGMILLSFLAAALIFIGVGLLADIVINNSDYELCTWAVSMLVAAAAIFNLPYFSRKFIIGWSAGAVALLSLEGLFFDPFICCINLVVGAIVLLLIYLLAGLGANQKLDNKNGGWRRSWKSLLLLIFMQAVVVGCMIKYSQKSSAYNPFEEEYTMEIVEPDTVPTPWQLYDNGEYAKAFQGLKELADNGDVYAQARIGYMYYAGEGTAQNYESAIDYTTRAAHNGNATAQYNLGIFYEFGYGIDKDLNTAKYCYSLAAAQNYEDAKTRLRELDETNDSTKN